MLDRAPAPTGRRPRVLFAIGGLGGGGSEKQLVEVAARTHPHAIDAIIVTWDRPAGLPNERRLEGLRVMRRWIGPIKVARPLIPVVTAWRVAMIIREVRPDVTYTWLEEASLFFGPLARLHGIPVIVARRNVCGASIERYRLVSWLIRRSERMATLVSGNSQAVVDDAVVRGVRPARLRLVPNAHENVPPLPAPEAGTVLLGYVARFRPEKGHHRLLQALALLETVVPWRIDLAGDGELMATVEREVAANGLSDRVRFVGSVADVRAFWADHHIAVLLSDHEGSPNALIEAAHAARPIVATAVGGIPEVVAPGGGLLVAPDDPAAIAAALKRLIEEDELRRELGATAYAQAATRFDVENVISMHRQLVREAIGARRRRSARAGLRRRYMHRTYGTNTEETTMEGQENVVQGAGDGRFEFGANWQRFLSVLDDDRIAAGEEDLRAMLGEDSLEGRSVLDIGSGSGLSSLSALRLGAADVHSFDYDPLSVACTAELRRRYRPDDPHWTVERGDAIDTAYVRGLGQFDIVYSWGVLHHTGHMWTALENAAAAVAPGGRFFIAIYNDQGLRSRIWRFIKQTYGRVPPRLQAPFALAVMLPRELLSAAASTARLKPQEYVHSWTRYSVNRGMSRWHDLIDWVGGYPFEVATPDEIFAFGRDHGFVLESLRTTQGGLGCNQFVFRRADPST